MPNGIFQTKIRFYHTATLINSKLYILGGNSTSDDEVVGKDFFYLDFSVPFSNIQNLLWQDLSSVNTLPSHYGAASVNGGANNNTLFLYGGYNFTAMEMVYTFNPQSNSCSIPKITGINNARKRLLTGIIDDSGKMYLWGGNDENNLVRNDMLISKTYLPFRSKDQNT